MSWDIETKPDEAYIIQKSIGKLQFQCLHSMSPGAGHAREVSAHVVSCIEIHIGRQRRPAHRNSLLYRWPENLVNRLLCIIQRRLDDSCESTHAG